MITKTQAALERRLNELDSTIKTLQRKGGLLNLKEAKRLEHVKAGYEEAYNTFMSCS